jgi:16S rRNA (cytosine1402-N4)-methyltransferase
VTLQKQKQAKMHQNKNQNSLQHVPVLLDAVLKYLDPQINDRYLDLTAGYGGHAKEILKRVGSLAQSVLVDRDLRAIEVLKKKFDGNVEIRHQDFHQAAGELLQAQRQFDLILADLGTSSPHLNEGQRGFAIKVDGPLDMRMDQSQELTAEIIVNNYSEAALTDLLRRYGEEPRSKAIAKAIVEKRPLTRTSQLAELVRDIWPGQYRLHPATRTFQALRIAVNNEIELIEISLPLWLKLLAPGGRIAIISFHSLEDRLVKQALQAQAGVRYDAEVSLLTKHPVVPTPSEIAHNPRARSAKLRAAVKIKKKGN